MKKVVTLQLALIFLTTTLLAGSEIASAEVIYTNSNGYVNSEYNRQGVADFAVKYAAKPGYTVTPYTTFGDSALGGDCTNFASQALHIGGGLGFHGSYGYNRNTVDWYYYGPTVPAYNGDTRSGLRTSSWTGADMFRQHWGVKNGVGGGKAYMVHRYTKKEAYEKYSEIYDFLWKGDLIQYVDGGGLTYHTQIVWKYDNATETMNVAQHSDTGGVWSYGLGLRTELYNRRNEDGWVVLINLKYSPS